MRMQEDEDEHHQDEAKLRVRESQCCRERLSGHQYPPRSLDVLMRALSPQPALPVVATASDHLIHAKVIESIKISM